MYNTIRMHSPSEGTKTNGFSPKKMHLKRFNLSRDANEVGGTEEQSLYLHKSSDWYLEYWPVTLEGCIQS